MTEPPEKSSEMTRLIAIIGPTATGKSQLAIKLAQRFNGEIIGADSRQIYRHMDIGTDKPSPKDLSLAPHHLIGIINPNSEFSLPNYQEMAYNAINDIKERGCLPLLVGGSGLYVWAVLEGWSVPKVPPNAALRQSLEEKAANGGGDALYDELVKADPQAANSIDKRNIRRVIRALEVIKSTGQKFSSLQQKEPPPYKTLIIGLTAKREELYRRIDLRVDKMIEKGLAAEIDRLAGMGYGLDLPSMSGIGYRQIGSFLKGEIKLEEAVSQMKGENHRFARHQYNWFRLKDDRISWFDVEDSQTEAKITKLIEGFLKDE